MPSERKIWIELPLWTRMSLLPVAVEVARVDLREGVARSRLSYVLLHRGVADRAVGRRVAVHPAVDRPAGRRRCCRCCRPRRGRRRGCRSSRRASVPGCSPARRAAAAGRDAASRGLTNLPHFVVARFVFDRDVHRAGLAAGVRARLRSTRRRGRPAVAELVRHHAQPTPR